MSNPANEHVVSDAHGFPWSHIIGYILSLALTFFALWMVTGNVMPREPLTAVILVAGVLQIMVQLFFFMHIREAYGPRYHIVALSLGLFFTFCVVAGSIWIMTFGGYQAY